MITIYFDFRQFSSKKFAFFLKSRCYHPILQKLALFWTKNADFSTKVFGENIFKMMTSVTDLCTYVFHRDVSGTDVIILKYFRRKFWQKIGVFDLNKARLCKILIITLVFGKNANFFAENCQKSKKIVIITSTPDIKCTISTNGCINFHREHIFNWSSKHLENTFPSQEYKTLDFMNESFGKLWMDSLKNGTPSSVMYESREEDIGTYVCRWGERVFRFMNEN
jgi:hypothetical protein